MKIRRFLALPLVLIFLLALVTGCSAPAAGDAYATVSKGSAAENLAGGDTETGTSIPTDRKLIRRIYLDAETRDMDTLLSNVTARVAQLGGYVEAREIYNGSSYSGTTRRNATLTIRIPADKLDDFVEHVAQDSNIISNTEESDDVTLQYAATESRLKVLRAEEERLLAFLAEATTVAEMISIETRLTDVLAEIETTTSQLNIYNNLVDYGTVTLSINEVKEYTKTEDKEPTVWEQISTGFVKSLQNVGKFLKGLFVLIVVASPYLALIAVVLVIVLVIRKFQKNKKQQKKTEE